MPVSGAGGFLGFSLESPRGRVGSGSPGRLSLGRISHRSALHLRSHRWLPQPLLWTKSISPLTPLPRESRAGAGAGLSR